MRHLVAAGGLATACACALLFSGAAGATGNDPFGWTPTTVTLTAPAGGTSAATITFTNNGSLPAYVGQFSTRSPFVIQTNNCTSPSIPYKGTCSVTVDLAGTTPGLFTGSLNFVWTSGSLQGTDAIPLSGTVTAAPSECHCTKLSVLIEDFRTEAAGRRFVFFVHWKLDCAIGSTGGCAGLIVSTNVLSREVAHHGLHLILPPDSPTFAAHAGPLGETFTVYCGHHSGGCTSDVIRGNEEFALAGSAKKRENLTLLWQPEIWCFELAKAVWHKRTLKLEFNAEGNIDRRDSKLSAEVP